MILRSSITATEGSRHTRQTVELNDYEIECDVWVTTTHDGTEDTGKPLYRDEIEATATHVSFYDETCIPQRWPLSKLPADLARMFGRLAKAYIEDYRRDILERIF